MAAAAARILIVEDTPTQAEVARSFLRELGHELRVVETGAAAPGDPAPPAGSGPGDAGRRPVVGRARTPLSSPTG